MSDWTKFDWKDITPDPIPEVPGHVAQIAYSPKFQEVMSIFRACAAKGEISPRVLALTQAVIELNPAHYSVWDYRFEIAKKIGNSVFDFKQQGLTPKSLTPPLVGEDGEWLNQFTLTHAKNYQIWNYRQHLIDPKNPLWFVGERLLVSMIFEDDAKNFHAWSHLKWVVVQSRKTCESAFGNGSSLLAECDAMLKEDVWNNSVWSFRYFLFAHYPELLDIQNELKYTASCLTRAPDNESVWAYLRGLVANLIPTATARIKKIAMQYPDEPRAIELLAELSSGNEATELWHKLCELEPLRRSFWEARMVKV